MNCGCFKGGLFGSSSGQSNKRSEQFETRAPAPPRTLAHSDAVCSVTAASNGCFLSGSKDKAVILYDVGKKSIADRWLGHDQEVSRVAFGFKRNICWSAGRDKVVRIWQHGNQNALMSLIGHELVINGLALNTDNTTVCTGSRDNSVRFWDATTGQCTKVCEISRNLVTWISWCKQSNAIVQSSEDKEVRVWDARSMAVVKSFPRKQYIQTCCDISDDGLTCISSSNGFGGNGCEVTVWDVRQGQMLHELSGHSETVNCCTMLPPAKFNGRRLAATSSNDTTVRVWDLATTECCHVSEVPASGPVTGVTYSSSDNKLAVSTFNSGIHVYRIQASDRDPRIQLYEEASY